MKLVKFEFLKIITNKLFIITFLLFIGANFIFLNYSNYNESNVAISYKSYKLLELDLKGKSHSEKGEFIKDAHERVYAINIIYNIQSNLNSENAEMRKYAKYLREKNRDLYNKYYEESKSNPIFKYTGDSDKELIFLEKVKNDYDEVSHYPEVIHEILEKSTSLQNISIFSKSKDNISIKNITRTTNAYQDMLGIKINYEINRGIDKLITTSLTDFFVLVLIFIISIILITEEKEKNLFTIIKSTKNGGIKTIGSKVVTLFLLVALISVLFYGMNFLYYLLTLGIGNVFSSIQSMSLFMLSTLKVNILEYLVIFFSSKILILFLFAIIMFYCAIKFNSSSESIIVITVLLLVSFEIFRGIDVNSSLNLLKSFNLVSLINTNEIYRVYGNLQFGSLLFEKISILLILQLLFVICFISLSIIKYLRSMCIITRDNILLSKIRNFKIFKNFLLHRIFSFELYKLLFINKAFIIFILFSCFLGFNYKHQSFNLSFNESFYKSYMDILNGDLTKEKEEIILSKKKEYDEAQEKIDEINTLIDENKLTPIEGNFAKMPYEDILSTKDMFYRIEEKYEYLKENKDASFVYDTGYNQLFRINNKVNEVDIYLLVVTIISLLSTFIMEYKTGFIHILNATKNGREVIAKQKIVASIFVCTVIFFISVIPEILYIYKMYGLKNLSSSIVSLIHFSNLPSFITIFEYLILFYITRYISYIMLVLLIDYISLKLKNQVFAFIISACILFIPIIFNGLKFIEMDIFPFMNLSWIIVDVFSFIFVPVIVIIAIILYNSILKRLE